MGSDRDLLDHDEDLLVAARLHPAALLAPAALFVAALAGAVAIGVAFPSAPVSVAWVLVAMVGLPALWLFGRLLRWRTTRFLLTTRRVLYRRGVLRRDVVQLRLQRVAEVNCAQTLGDRLIGRGRLVLDVVGAEAPFVVSNVRRPRRLQRMVNVQLDRLEEPRGGTRRWAEAVPARSRTATLPRAGWRDTPPHGTVRTPAGGDPASVSGALVQLDELRRRGVISDAEFSAKKAELLDRL